MSKSISQENGLVFMSDGHLENSAKVTFDPDTNILVLGSADTDKIGFFGATPIVRRNHVADVSVAHSSLSDADADLLGGAINSIFATLEAYGLHKVS